ncbi:MAG: sugar phosphate isomerase/epimerase [Clostridiales bacterium]|jgi:sugar phosphate isomerase/epimerase|nr:sugar phosphate isomerase/epimerase [Clostridiales bacterium]
MYQGFITGCLGDIPLKEKAKWSKDNGFKALEVSCWPRENERDYSGSDIDVENLDKGKADEIKGFFKEYGLTLSSIAYYDNNLHADHNIRESINKHSYKCIDAAQMLGVESVGVFAGRNHTVSLQVNFNEFKEIFTRMTSYAADKGVKIVIENCPMVGWQIPGYPGTISFTPELWEEMFDRVPAENFGLNYDPSHLYFQMIDYIKPIKTFKDKIFHVHAKDAEIFEDNLKYYGIFDKQLDRREGPGFWRYRLPGLGKVDFKAMIAELESIGYKGAVSIEHEDLLYSGSEAKVKEGLLVSQKFLSQFIK